MEPAQDRRRLGLGGRSDPLLCQLVHNETVNLVVAPCGLVARWLGHRRVGDRLVAPPGPILGGDWIGRCEHRARRPGSPGGHPSLDARDRLVVEPAGGRHLERLIPQGREQQALLRLAGHDRRPGVAAGQHPCSGGEVEPRLLLCLAVATEAMGHQQRPGVDLEEVFLARSLVRQAGTGGSQSEKGEEGNE